jgi:hypothetical protein
MIDWFDYQDARLWMVELRYGRANDPSFDTLLTALVLKADPSNLARLEAAFPEKVACIREREAAPAGILTDDPPGVRREVGWTPLHIVGEQLRLRGAVAEDRSIPGAARRCENPGCGSGALLDAYDECPRCGARS